jgi:hypothetical protein
MATLECDHETVSGVTLVECRLTSEAPACVTIEPTHDGPIWPPRRHGVPAAGWDDDGWTGHVPDDGVRALGYATPSEPDEPPVRIAETAPPDGDDPVSAQDVIRSLGDPTPTRDAVPPADVQFPDAEDPAEEGHADEAADEDDPDEHDAATAEPADGPVDPSLATDLDAIETRLWTARDLASVSSVEEARAAVDRAGGLGAVRSLATQLEADRERLTALAERIDRLADEADAVAVPVGSLERLV